MTKKQEALLNNYERATARDLWDVYGTFSRAKANAFESCRELQYRMNGYDGRICSANSFSFTYAFKFEHVNEETGVCEEWLYYMTSQSIYKFYIADM